MPQNGAALYWDPRRFPGWLNGDHFDIEARIPEEDLAAWAEPGRQQVMLREMLQSFLAERCKLVVHREQIDAKVYYLEIAKGGPKFGSDFKEAKGVEPDTVEQPRVFPGGGRIASDGGQMRFYHAPMALLASMLTNRNLGGREIQDHTGRTGPSLFSAVAALGLKLEAANGKSEILMLDHVERPSQN